MVEEKVGADHPGGKNENGGNRLDDVMRYHEAAQYENGIFGERKSERAEYEHDEKPQIGEILNE
jgi:hypothetical protein